MNNNSENDTLYFLPTYVVKESCKKIIFHVGSNLAYVNEGGL